MNKKKGFTLAELLIVVAIIAVLVGVAIPVFTSQLEKSRESVDLANIRSALAECTTVVLTGGETTGTSVTYNATSGATATVPLKQKTGGFSGDNATVKIGGVLMSTITGLGDVTVTVSPTGAVSITQ